MYKPKLKKIQILLQKDEKLYLYITKYICNLVNKEISLIKKFQPL